MSGFTNVTGFAPPTNFAGFMGLLQTASFRGIPFKVVAAQVKKGRRWAIHEYPFVDGGWPEDLGRTLRAYSFSGYLIGDLAPVMQNLLNNAIETKGPGLLIHPTIGAVRVGLISASSAVHRDKMRVIEVQFEFVEAGDSLFPLAIIATVVSVLAAAASALTASNISYAAVAAPAAAVGPAVTGAGASVVSCFAASVTAGGANPTAIVGMATALPPPDSGTSFGRYGAGSATTLLPIGTTVASLQGQLGKQRAALALAGSAAVSAALSYSASTDMLAALAALVEAMRAGITNPASQVRVLIRLAGFNFTDGAGGSVGVGAAMAVMRDATAAACRRAVLISLARAAAAYQPTSYDDAASLRELVAAALDAEITAAGDNGEDAAYAALKALRSAVVRDLTVRGASLPGVATVNLRLPLPALTVAQMLYTNAARSDEIIARSGAVHPAFIPVSFKALTSGLGPNINAAIPPVTAASVGNVLIAPSQAGGIYHLPPPGGPSGLNVLSVTSTTASLSWSAPPSGGLPSSYIVQVSPHGAGAWTNAGAVPGSSAIFTATGLSGGTAYDFQVIARNATGNSAPSDSVATTTPVNPPNAVTSLTASAGSPSYSAVALSWTASAVDGTHAAATSFAVNYGTNGTTWTLASGAWTSGTTATVTGLAHATGYYFQVIASNSGGAGGTGATGSTITTDIAAPNALAISAVAPVSDGSITKLTVTWAAPATDGTHDAATGYDLQYRTSPSGSWTTQTGVASPVTITGLTGATAYDVQVRGKNGSTATPGAWSATMTASTWTVAMTHNYTLPPASFVHGGTLPGGTNISTSPAPNNVQAAYGTSPTAVATSGWAAGANYLGAGAVWAWYLGGGASSAPGTVYLWAQARTSGGTVIGQLESGPFAVT